MAAGKSGDGSQGTFADLWADTRRARKPAASRTEKVESVDGDDSSSSASTPALQRHAPSPGSASAPWSVRELVAGIRRQMELEHQDVWVAGEISNCRPASSGHIYFTLKDGDAQLGVVLFRRQAMLLRFRPQDGVAVLARGRVSVYESRGQLQLIAETLEPRGAGALQLAFEQLKARLLAEGLFETSRKRPLPAFPRCIGVVTSTSGAVLHDIVKVVRRRHARLHVLVYPATMQGPGCAASVAAGIRWFNDNPGRVEAIAIARGGGSMEDLAGFNDEALARTIAASALPVVSAIGHETDFTIADFVADLRAPTPSAAAEIITAAQHRIEERVQALDSRMQRAVRYQVMLSHQRFAAVSIGAIRGRLMALAGRRSQRVDDLAYRLEAAMARRLRARAAQLAALAARAARQNPAIRVAAARRRLEQAGGSLERIGLARLAVSAGRLDRVSTRLMALSPLAVLSRGYSIVYDAAGQVVREADRVRAGERIRVRVAKGSLAAQVTEADPS